MANPRVLRFYAVLAIGFAVGSAAARAHAQAADFNVTAGSNAAYMINGSSNPSLNLLRGHTYTFNVNSPGHPFYIKTAQVTGTGSAYNQGVLNNGTDSGTILFAVPTNAPAGLFYICSVHGPMTGALTITGTAPVPALPAWAWLLLLASLLAAGIAATRKQTRALVR